MVGIRVPSSVQGIIFLLYCFIILSCCTSETENTVDTTASVEDTATFSASSSSSSRSSSSFFLEEDIDQESTTVVPTHDTPDDTNTDTTKDDLTRRKLGTSLDPSGMDDTAFVHGGSAHSVVDSVLSSSSSSSHHLPFTNISRIVRQPPSWSVSTPSNAHGKTLTILIMTHKRPQGIEKLFNYIYNTSLNSGLYYVPSSSSPSSSGTSTNPTTITLPIHIIIAQSASKDIITGYERKYRSVQEKVSSSSSTTVIVPDCSTFTSIPSIQSICETRNILERYAPHFASIRHVFTPYVQYDTSISNNYHAYGSMHNALRNLYHGLYIAFHTLSSYDQNNLVQLIHQQETAAGIINPTPSSPIAETVSVPSSPGSSGSSGSSNSIVFTNTITKIQEGLLRKARTAAEMAQNTLNDIAVKPKKYKDLLYTLYDEEEIFKNIVATEDTVSPSSSSSSVPSSLIIDNIAQKLPREVLVMEDDAELTDDALSFFTAAARIMKQHDHHVDFATGYVLYRPNMVVGTMDIDLIQMYRRQNYNSSATVIDRIKATPRIVFKTFAWMLTRKGWYTQLRTVMERLANSNVDSVSSEILNITKQKKFRSIQPEFQGCVWCFDYCYDHLIEWILQDNTFLAPSIPRIRQTAGQGGMTYTENSVNYIWDGEPVYDPSAYTLHSGLMTLMRIFQTIGYSGIAVPRPNSLDELRNNHDTDNVNGDNDNLIDIRISRIEIARIVLSEPLVSFLLLCAAVLSVFIAISLASWVHQRVITRKLLKAH